jgi:hypothetical protein
MSGRYLSITPKSTAIWIILNDLAMNHPIFIDDRDGSSPEVEEAAK